MAKKSKEDNWSPMYEATVSKVTEHQNNVKKLDQNLENKLKTECAKEQLEHLKKLDSDYENLEFLTDLVVFKRKDGVMKACLIYDGNQKTMADYATNQEFACLSHDTQLNYSFKIYSLDDVCVVCVNGSHGTHVAGIAAAYHPDCPEKNGTAPGAQVVSIKIGDSRVDTLETCPGVVRALRACIQNNVSVANLSYGEPAGYFQKGAFFDELRTTFLKHKMLFITSAGNSGPALTTVGAPAALGEYAMSVGAYAAPKSHEPLYSLNTELPEINYTWSSRGPTIDGGRGVDVCAPGVAITAVPTATLNRNGLMNGTSMAAPNATGCAATILSALPAGYNWTPAQLKRVMMNSARKVVGVEPESQGAGLVQVQSAVDIFEKTDNTHYKVQVGSVRGIYIRHPSLFEKKITYRVEITPEFHDSLTNEQIIEYEKHLLVKNKARWIETPQYVHMSSATKGFAVTVDVKSLGANTRNTTLIELVEDGTNQLICVIPVTVVKGKDIAPGDEVQKTKNFAPGEIVRDYYTVPENATYAKFTCSGSGGKYLVHSMQSIVGQNYSKFDNEWFLNIIEGGRPRTFYYKVMGAQTLELVMSKFWSETNADGEVTWSIQFGGMNPKTNTLHVGPGITELDFINSTSEKLGPKIELSRVEIPMAPQSFEVISLTHPLDIPLDKHKSSYKSIIQYDMKLANDGEIQIEMPLLREVLYENMFAESNFFIYNSDNKRVHFGENFKPTNWKKKLTKGDYKVVVELVHNKKSVLEAISKKLILINSMKLKDAVGLDCYHKRDEAILSGTKAGDCLYSAGNRNFLYINSNGSNLDKDEVGKMEGRVLTGNMTFYTGDMKNAFKLPVKYPILPKADIKSEKEVKAKKDTTIAALQRNQAVTWVKNGDGDVEFFNSQKELYPTHVPLYHARLQHVVKNAKAGNPVNGEELDGLVKSILDNVDLKEVIFTLNKKNISSPEEKKVQDDNKELKNAYITAKAAQIRAMIKANPEQKSEILNELTTISEVIDFIAEKSNTDVMRMTYEVATAMNLPGLQLKSITRLNDAKSAKENAQMLENAYEKLGWEFALEQQKRLTVANYPLKQYRI